MKKRIIAFGLCLTFLWMKDALSQNDTALYINSEGHIGIGTTAPLQPLHVNGNIRVNNNIAIGRSVISNQQLTIQSGGKNYIPFNVTDSANTVNLLSVTQSGSVIMNGGSVGIGTTTPSEQLHVNGNILVDSNIAIGRSVISNQQLTIQSRGKNYIPFNVTDSANTVNLLSVTQSGSVIMNGGKVGIGTTSPDALLHVKSSSVNSQTLLSVGTNNNESAQFRTDAKGAGVLDLYNQSGSRVIKLHTSGNTYFNGSGNIGIGTETPSYPLEITTTFTSGDYTKTALHVSGSGTSSGKYGTAIAKFINTGTGAGIYSSSDSHFPTVYTVNSHSNTSYITGIVAIVASSSNAGFGTNGHYSTTNGSSILTHLETGKGNKVMTSPLVPRVEIHLSGQNRLKEGKIDVKFDQEQLDIMADGNYYKVLITPTAMCNGLVVTQKDNKSFTVEELNTGSSSATFDWFLVCDRANSLTDQSAIELPKKLPEISSYRVTNK